MQCLQKLSCHRKLMPGEKALRELSVMITNNYLKHALTLRSFEQHVIDSVTKHSSRPQPVGAATDIKDITIYEIVAMPRCARHRLQGQVVLVPADLSKVTSCLPRPTHERQI